MKAKRDRKQNETNDKQNRKIEKEREDKLKKGRKGSVGGEERREIQKNLSLVLTLAATWK